MASAAAVVLGKLLGCYLIISSGPSSCPLRPPKPAPQPQTKCFRPKRALHCQRRPTCHFHRLILETQSRPMLSFAPLEFDHGAQDPGSPKGWSLPRFRLGASDNAVTPSMA